MWVSGVTQGLMWKAVTDEGALLYPSFVETLIAIRPMYLTRMVGGTLYIIGYVLMLVNLIQTIRAGAPVETSVTVVEEEPSTEKEVAWQALVFSRPILLSVFALLLIGAFFLIDSVKIWIPVVTLMSGFLVAAWIAYASKRNREGQLNVHRALEGRSLIFTALVLIAVLIGGVAEILPTIVLDRAVPLTGEIQKPYRPLELHGRDIYVREGCYVCHSQMIRPFRSEKLRYGDPSTAGEFIYDHPFQWGSKRTGPDLHRVGGKYGNLWHYQHMMDPRSTSQGSNMPSYAFLSRSKLDLGDTAVKMNAMKTLGVPYSGQEISASNGELETQAKAIAADLRNQGINLDWDSQMVAMIAYLQRLGRGPVPIAASTK
jgi:cytochrome c oxidase cbb3-type subunit I/II